MTDLLLIDGLDINSAAAGIYLANGFDFGAPVKDTEAVTRLLVDGEVRTGRRASNRTITLPLVVLASSRLDLAAKVSVLARAVDKPSFTLQWTPEGLSPVVFDCYRASLSQVWSIKQERQFTAQITLTFQALPFTRPLEPVSIAAPVATPVTVDTFDATTGLTSDPALPQFTTTYATSTNRVEGAASVQMSTPYSVVATGQPYTAPDGSTVYVGGVAQTAVKTVALDLTNFRQLSLSLSPLTTIGQQGVSVQVKLTDNTGKVATFGAYSPRGPGWRIVQVDTRATSGIPAGFNFASIAQYNLRLDYSFTAPAGSSGTIQTLVDGFFAYPTVSGTSNQPASLLRFDGVAGIARTPGSFTVVAASAISRLLVSRSPNPPVGFDPLLNAPASASAALIAGEATAIGGSYYRFSQAVHNVVYQRKALTLRGTYTLLVRVRLPLANGATPTLTVKCSLAGDANYIQTLVKPITGLSATAWSLVAIGELNLPPRGVSKSNTTQLVDITFTSNAANGTANLDLDEAYLVDLAGDTVLVDLPAGVSYTRFYLDAPDPAGFGADVYAGTAADRSDAISVAPWVVGQGAFNLDPGSNTVIVIMDKSDTGGTVAFSYFPKYHGPAPT